MTLRIVVPKDIDPAVAAEAMGPIPAWLDEDDPRPAREQLDQNYQHGGGWDPFIGFKLLPDGSIKYPGDPALKPLAALAFRKELILFFPFAWVMILQKDGTFEICRMD
jgi:hypothetical protein